MERQRKLAVDGKVMEGAVAIQSGPPVEHDEPSRGDEIRDDDGSKEMLSGSSRVGWKHQNLVPAPGCSNDEGSGSEYPRTDISSSSSPGYDCPGSVFPKAIIRSPHPSHDIPELSPPSLVRKDPTFLGPDHCKYWLSGNSSEEPDPSSVAAKLRKEALDNPQEEPSIEELLSSMGVSLPTEPHTLDYSLAVEYQEPFIKETVPDSKFLMVDSRDCKVSDFVSSLPVAYPMDKGLPEIRSKPMLQLSTEPQRNITLMPTELESSCEGSETPSLFTSDSAAASIRQQQAGLRSGPKNLSRTSSSGNGILHESPLVAEAGALPCKGAETSLHPSTRLSDVSCVQGTNVCERQEDGSLRPQSNFTRVRDYVGDRSAPLMKGPSTSSPIGVASSAMLLRASSEPVLERRLSSNSGGSLGSLASSPSPSELSNFSGPILLSSMEENFAEPYKSGEDADMAQDGRTPRDSVSTSSKRTLDTGTLASETLKLEAVNVNMAETGSSIPMTPVMLHRKKGGCSGCAKGNLLQEKENCMVCSAKYCSSCVVSAMGSMPEGRKCITCLGQPIHETRRAYIGKPSRLLKKFLGPLEVQQIMKAERECPANQLRPEQVVVNKSNLSHEELTALVGCSKPPPKLKPGRYWYDTQTGLWGKEGHKPERIISPSLKVGGNLQTNASNGQTKVYMNGRELGRLELKMLKLAGVNCPPDTHLWVNNDGSYSEEGFKQIKGNIWGKDGNLFGKASLKLLYPFFSLPTPQSNTRGSNGSANQQSNTFPDLYQTKIHKLLLLGHEGSGRSTIFKQAKILYKDGFTKEEVASFKFLIQANIYKYMAILLEGRERFEDEEDDFAETSVSNFGESTSSTAAAGIFNRNERKKKSTSKQDNVYRLEPNMKQVSDWFMENIPIGNLESSIFPNASHAQEHAAKIEQLWLNPAIQATYKRKPELHQLPDVANYFLDRVVEVCRSDYEPVETDILQSEGLSQGSGLVQVEISLEEKLPYSGSWQDTDVPSGRDRYQVIRVGGRGMSDRHKWLDMFEDVRAVVFCVALSDYDSLWVDSSGTASNKMIQTRDLFESILRHPCFQDTPFVLLLNKYDMFEDKIFRGVPLTDCTWFSDFRPVGTSHYTPQNQAQQAYQYIAHKYKELFTSINCTGRKLFTFQLNALDKITVSRAFQYVKEILKWEDQKASAWGMIPEDLSYSTDISSFSHPSGTRQPDEPKREHY